MVAETRIRPIGLNQFRKTIAAIEDYRSGSVKLPPGDKP